MYNRYTPQPDGSFTKKVISEISPDETKAPEKAAIPNGVDGLLKQIVPLGLDSADLLVIVMLLLISGDDSGQNNALLTLVIYLFL